MGQTVRTQQVVMDTTHGWTAIDCCSNARVNPRVDVPLIRKSGTVENRELSTAMHIAGLATIQTSEISTDLVWRSLNRPKKSTATRKASRSSKSWSATFAMDFGF